MSGFVRLEKTVRFPKKEKILTESFRLFLSRGYDAVSFTDIEKAANVTRGIIFYYFKGKEDLLRQVADAFVIQFLKSDNLTEGCSSSPTPLKIFLENCIDRIRERIRFFFDEVGDGIEITAASFLSFTLYLRDHHAGWKDSLKSFKEELYLIWEEAITLAKDRGEIRKDVDTHKLITVFFLTYTGAAYDGALDDKLLVEGLYDSWMFTYQSYTIK